MKNLLWMLLSTCLVISVGLNVYLLTRSGSDIVAQTSPIFSQNDNEPESHDSPVQALEDSTQGVVPPQDVYALAQNLISDGEHSRALEVIQTQLRRNSDDVRLLLLEADLLARRLGPADALATYYDLLKLPLSDQQRVTLIDKIEHLANFHIENLRRLKSWDILSDFLEPLWQFDPNQRSYIVPLAEAYAFQRLQAPMENVLASLYPDDPDVSRIRQLLYQSRQQLEEPSTPVEEVSAVAQGTPLRQLGDHYIVRGILNNTQVELMIDTGASTTVLTESAFNRIANDTDSSFIGQYRINTAGGQVIAPVYKMNRLNIAGYEVTDLAVVVLGMEDFTQAEGLLGMNFLREFDFRIDQNSAQLFLNSRN